MYSTGISHLWVSAETETIDYSNNHNENIQKYGNNDKIY